MITPLSSRLVFSAFTFLTFGILLGNMLLVYMGLMPVILLLSGLLLQKPSSPLGAELNIRENHYVGDIIRIKRSVKVVDGVGPVLVGEELPRLFELIEGSNIKLFWKGLAPLDAEFSYSVRCTKRGIYELDVMRWETKHGLELLESESGEFSIKQTLIVQTYPLQVKKIRQQKIFSNVPMPSEAQVKLGIPTTEFKEIREYSYGDPFKNINWKATSRRTYLMKPPMVNQFEMEGMKIVWLFLNTSTSMALGTTISNSLEYGIQAVMGLSQFYLGRNCRVGVTLYDDSKAYKVIRKRGEDDGSVKTRMMADFDPKSAQNAPIKGTVLEPGDFIIPDLGKRQLYSITHKMLETEISKGLFNLKQSVVNCRGHIIGGNPLFYIVTSVGKANYKSLEEGINELKRYTTTSRHLGSPIVVVHIAGYKIKASNENEKYAAEILEIEKQKYFRRLRRKGVMVVKWDPTRYRFTDMLLSQVRRR